MKQITAASILVMILVICSESFSSGPGTERTAQSSRSARRSAQQNEPIDRTDRQVDMRSKLEMVRKIVEGISTDDFEMVEKGAMDLVALAESAAWKSSRDPYYLHYSRNFEESAKGLIAAAKKKSPEKATFAYVHVTFSCTACHHHVRGVIRTAR